MRIFLAKEKADKDICSQRGEGGQGIFLAKEKTDVGQGIFLVEKDKADKDISSQRENRRRTRGISSQREHGQGYF